MAASYCRSLPLCHFALRCMVVVVRVTYQVPIVLQKGTLSWPFQQPSPIL